MQKCEEEEKEVRAGNDLLCEDRQSTRLAEEVSIGSGGVFGKPQGLGSEMAQ